MHTEVENFITNMRKKYPRFFKNSRVLEVGSLDINGSIRSYFTDCDYTGLDIGEGPGVDVVCPVHMYNEEGRYGIAPFDVVISTEMLEHDIHWMYSLGAMYRLLSPGGLLILTCAGPARHEHGTTRTTPGDSPFTNDYYRNISMEDFSSVLREDLFQDYNLRLVRGDTDLQFYGIKYGNI